MSKSSTNGAVRPHVIGQQQNDKSSFFAQAAQWVEHVLKTGRTKGEPPRIPVWFDREGEREFFHGRGIFKVLFDRTTELNSVDIRGWHTEDIESEFIGPVLNALQALDIHVEVPEKYFQEFLSELEKLRISYPVRSVIQMRIEDEDDPEEGSFGDDEFDADEEAPAPAETVADMADEKSARTKEKPAKSVETFTKISGWIKRLKMPANRKTLLAELVRAGHKCPAVTYVGNTRLADETGVLPRQVQRNLKALADAGHITIRKYRSEWCPTQRVIIVNDLARRAGIDPQTVDIPTENKAFFTWIASIGHKIESARPNKPAANPSVVVTTNAIGCHTGHPIGESSNAIGCHTGRRGGVMHDTRREEDFSLPLKRQKKNHPAVADSTSPPRGVLPPSAGTRSAEPARSASPAPKSERAAVEAKKVSTARPPIDWPERNLPTVNRESALARMVRQGRITHLHPRWLDGLACWVVRCRTIDGRKMFIPPKSMDDGWIVNTVDTVVVPLIDPENRRISQDEFRRILACGSMVAPDPNQQVIESQPPKSGLESPRTHRRQPGR